MGRRPAARRALTTDDAAGLFGPDSEAWRLDREAYLLLGAGPRALLLQLAHPLVAEGVDQHSSFRDDPWARLRGTLRSYLRLVYGSRPVALAEADRLRRLHARVTGPVRDPAAAVGFGPAYDARDADLALWVHATLVDSTLAAYRSWLEPIPDDRARRFYAETVPLGVALGIPAGRLPAGLDAFEAYMAAMLAPDGPVHPTATARTLAEHILHPTLGPLAPPIAPLLRAIPAPLYDWLLWPAVGLLPPALRDEYGIAWSPPRRLVAAGLLAGWRTWNPLVPTGLRWMPQARAADRRVAAARSRGGGGAP